MAEKSEAARKLKALRKRTGLSVREVATKLGKPSHSSYSHYEDAYKKPTLPADLIAALVPIFKATGQVSANELWALTAAHGKAAGDAENVNDSETSPKISLTAQPREREEMRKKAIADAALRLLLQLSIDDRLSVLEQAVASPEDEATPHPTYRARP